MDADDATDATSLLTAAFGPEDGALLLQHLQLRRVAEGEALLIDGERSSSLFMLVEGALRVVHEGSHGKVVLGDRVPGDWVGEVGLIDGGPATATVQALVPSSVLCMERATLERLSVEQPHVASILLRAVTRQLAERVWASSSGIVEQVGSWVTVRKPEEVRGLVARMFDWLLGGERAG